MKNLTILIGRVGREVQVQEFPNNTIMTMSVATTDRLRKSDGTWVSKTDWHVVKVWGKLAQTMTKMISKGDVVMVEGASTKDKYITSSGNTSFIHYVRAKSINVISKGGDAPTEEEDEPLSNEELVV